MELPPLLQLPTEILLNILKFSVSSPDPPPHVTLINLSQTCSHLHHAIFCSENDSVWHGPALALGIPESLHLEQVLYPGSSTVQRRLWQNVVKLNLGWSRPFAAGTPVVPRSQKVPRGLPPPDTKGDWFGRRTIELFTYGEGNRKGAVYWSKHTSAKDDGCAIFQVRSGKAATVAASMTRVVTGVLDPVLGKVREVASEWKPQGTWTATPFPVSAGFLVEERNGEYRVRAVDAQTMGLSQLWNLGRRIPDRFVANGEILVAVTSPDPDNSTGIAPHISSNLLCMESDRQRKDVWEEATETESKVVWEFDLSREWAEDEAYTSFPHLKNFHITRNHLVCLVTRHPSSTLGKLTRTNFLVVSLETGKVLKTMEFKTKSASVFSGNGARAAFTTAFAHDFLLTDTHIVSGGAGGGLLVWDYSKNDKAPVYIIPDPLDPSTAKINDSPSLPRQYSALSLSADGRFVGATTSDKLWLFDMVEKKVHGVYSNGRKVKKSDYYTKNPFDDFPAGVWCWWREWRSARNVKTGEVGWEEVEGGGVAYLTDLGDERSLMETKGIFQEAENYEGVTHLIHPNERPLAEAGRIVGREGVRVRRLCGLYWMDHGGEGTILERFKILVFLAVPVMIAFMVAMLIRYQRI